MHIYETTHPITGEKCRATTLPDGNVHYFRPVTPQALMAALERPVDFEKEEKKKNE